MKHSRPAARALSLLLALLCCTACTSEPTAPATSLPPLQAQGAAEVQSTPQDAAGEGAADEGQNAEDAVQTYPLREVGYGNQVCEVPGGFVYAVEEIAPALNEYGFAYIQYQLYFADSSTRTSEKIEGAVFVPETYEILEYAYPFYAAGRLYLITSHHLYSVNLDGSDARLEYAMPAPPMAEDITEELTEYESWINSWFTDGESLYFVRQMNIISSDLHDVFVWYYDSSPRELVRLHLPSGEEEVLYTAYASLFPCAIEGSSLYLREVCYEMDLAQFYDEDHRMADEAGYAAALETEWTQLVEIDTRTGGAKPVALATADGVGLLERQQNSVLPPLASARGDEGEWQGLYYYDSGAAKWVTLREESTYGGLMYFDATGRRLLASEVVDFDRETHYDLYNFQYWVFDLGQEGVNTQWEPFGVYGYGDTAALPVGVVDGYYVMVTGYYRTVGYARDGELVVQPTGDTQPGSELGDLWPYVVGTQPVYQLIAVEDFWAGNANLLPITVL